VTSVGRAAPAPCARLPGTLRRAFWSQAGATGATKVSRPGQQSGRQPGRAAQNPLHGPGSDRTSSGGNTEPPHEVGVRCLVKHPAGGRCPHRPITTFATRPHHPCSLPQVDPRFRLMSSGSAAPHLDNGPTIRSSDPRPTLVLAREGGTFSCSCTVSRARCRVALASATPSTLDHVQCKHRARTSRVGSSRPVGTVAARRSTYLRLVHLSTNLVLRPNCARRPQVRAVTGAAGGAVAREARGETCSRLGVAQHGRHDGQLRFRPRRDCFDLGQEQRTGGLGEKGADRCGD
jgi:hypothetical protein